MTGSPAGPSMGTRSRGMASAGSGTATLRPGTRIVACFITGQYSSSHRSGPPFIPAISRTRPRCHRPGPHDPRLFVDDLQDNATGVAYLQQGLGLEHVMRPLGGVDD